MLLVRYRDALAGRLLELGCGAGRLTGYLVDLGAEVHGIDLSPTMVEHCRRTYPQADFAVGDLRDLSAYGTGSFDAVVAAYNVIDVLDDADRRHVLAEIRRILVDGGLLVMSTHNRAYAPRVRGPLRPVRGVGTLRLVRGLALAPWRQRRRRRLLHLQRNERDYAILNDSAHGYRMLHYYIDRESQARQLAEAGFELLDCLDGDGRPVPAGEPAATYPDLHYAARAVARG
jgi:SAM-dependent methyltransferase